MTKSPTRATILLLILFFYSTILLSSEDRRYIFDENPEIAGGHYYLKYLVVDESTLVCMSSSSKSKRTGARFSLTSHGKTYKYLGHTASSYNGRWIDSSYGREVCARFEPLPSNIDKITIFADGDGWGSYMYKKYTINLPMSEQEKQKAKRMEYQEKLAKEQRKLDGAQKKAKLTLSIPDITTYIEIYQSASKGTKNKNINGFENAHKMIFNIVVKENNIVGYAWYNKNYYYSSHVRESLKRMHQLAFDKAKKIHTIGAYNDFVIAYPYSQQMAEANNRAYKLESEKYSGWFVSDEKLARGLLIQSKRLERAMDDYDKSGYYLVVNRMNQLLQDRFTEEDATLRYLESEEFKDFYRTFKKTMKDIKRVLNKISNNTSDLSSILRSQMQTMEQHFKDSARDREMADYYTREYRAWHRRMIE